jgi:hypothetical protein
MWEKGSSFVIESKIAETERGRSHSIRFESLQIAKASAKMFFRHPKATSNPFRERQSDFAPLSRFIFILA